MYIGSTGEIGLHHIVYEVVDNSIDEALAGYCDTVEVAIHLDNSITVIDNGRGIPVDEIKKEKRSAAEVVMTKLHAGGKFDSNAYKVSGGLHGVGVSCVNFLSEHLHLEIWRDGKTYEQEYVRGVPVVPLKQTGKTRKRGTKITFLPDSQIFTETAFSFDKLSERLREKAFLNKGIRITIKDEREEPERSHEFYYKGGIAEFVKHLNKNKSVLHDKPIYFEKESDALSIEVAIQYNDAYDEKVYSFANNINTVDGGSHLSGFRSAFTRTINAYAQSSGLAKNFKTSLTGDDVREGLVAVISVKLPQPQFEGQTKGKLNSDVKGAVESFLNDRLTEFFEQNPTVARKIVGKALDAARAREAADRFDKIAIRFGIAHHRAADRRHEVERIKLIQRIEPRHVDIGEFQAQEAPADLQRPVHFAQRHLDARHVADAERDRHRIETLVELGKGLHYLDAEKLPVAAGRIDNRDNCHGGFHRTQDSDFGEIRFAREHDAIEAARPRRLERARAFGLGKAKERKRVRQVLHRQPGFLRKPLRREVIGIAARRRVLNLDEAFFHAALEVGVDKAERDAEVGGDPALRPVAIVLYGVEQPENDALVLTLGIQQLVHGDCP